MYPISSPPSSVQTPYLATTIIILYTSIRCLTDLISLRSAGLDTLRTGNEDACHQTIYSSAVLTSEKQGPVYITPGHPSPIWIHLAGVSECVHQLSVPCHVMLTSLVPRLMLRKPDVLGLK